ncbi:MAG: hypothetical protein JSS66_04570 [Armatimonadetes bacterium]|nr:hypothetical protein [Armatimonadota bacterium]
MGDLIKQLAGKLGMDEDKAAEMAGHLQDNGHDLNALLQQGDIADKIHGLLGERSQEFLGHIPGIGGMLSGMFGQGVGPEEVQEAAETEA